MSNTSHIKSFVTVLKSTIQYSQLKAARLVNTELVQLYFMLGAAISKKVEKAQWGDKVLATISAELQKELKGLKGFSAQNLKKMKLFYEAYPEMLLHCQLFKELSNKSAELHDQIGSTPSNEFNQKIGSTLSNEFWQISFSNHFTIITGVKNREFRDFYILETYKNGWSNRVLQNHLSNEIHLQEGINNNFGKTLTEIKPEQAISQFRDEYLLDFINVDDADNERIIEDKIVQNIKDFILHMGKGFSFVGNQYKLEVGKDEFFIDLLFFNRNLQSLVAVELKRGKFKPEHLGQLSFYLSVLDDQVRLQHEKRSIGIVLCKEKDNTVVEYALQNNQQPMGVATFKTKQELPNDIKQFLPSARELKKLLNE